MKRLVSAFVLSVFVVSGSAAVANAAPAKSGSSAPVSSTDRVNYWPY